MRKPGLRVEFLSTIVANVVGWISCGWRRRVLCGLGVCSPVYRKIGDRAINYPAWPWPIRAALLLLLLLSSRAFAQYTNVSPQSTNPQVVLNAVSTTGASNPVMNIGQNVHFLSYKSNVNIIQIQLEGSFDCVNYVAISDQGTIGGSSTPHVISASGWYPCVRANIVKLSGTSPSVTATYTGTSATVPLTGAPYNSGGVFHQTVAAIGVTSANSSFSVNFAIPAVASAIVLLGYSSTGCTGSTLTVAAGVPASSGLSSAQNFTPASTAGTQTFIVPNFVGTTGFVTYVAGTGCSGQTVQIDFFSTPAALLASGGGGAISAAITSPIGPQVATTSVATTPGSILALGGIAVTNIGYAAAHFFYGVNVAYNKSASTVFVQCFNAGSLPTNGTVPSDAVSFPVPPSGTGFWTPPQPIPFGSGVYCVGSTTQEMLTIVGTGVLSLTIFIE